MNYGQWLIAPERIHMFVLSMFSWFLFRSRVMFIPFNKRDLVTGVFISDTLTNPTNYKINIKTKLIILNSIITSVIPYGIIIIWIYAVVTYMEKVRRVQKKFLRTILNASCYATRNIIHPGLKRKIIKEMAK